MKRLVVVAAAVIAVVGANASPATAATLTPAELCERQGGEFTGTTGGTNWSYECRRTRGRFTLPQIRKARRLCFSVGGNEFHPFSDTRTTIYTCARLVGEPA